jgi:hypothetical protein
VKLRAAAVGWAACLALAMLSPMVAASGIALGGPDVVKLTWNSRSLEVADLDGDDRNDLVVLDTDRSRITLLYQRRPGDPSPTPHRGEPGQWTPVLEDARFRSESLGLSGRAFDLEVADFNQDGRPDLAYTGSPDGLTIRYQGRRDRFETSETFDLRAPSRWRHTLEAADLDGDGRTDLVVLTEEALEVFMQQGDGRLVAAGRYPVTDEDRYGLRVMDANGDGAMDVMVQVAGSDHALRVRFGSGDGTFGAELAMVLDRRRGRMQLLADGPEPAFISVNAANDAIEEVRLSSGEADTFDLDEIQPRFVTLGETSESSDCHLAVGDIDGDGRPDLAVADSRAASLALLMQSRDGRFTRSDAYPSLAEVKGLKAADLDGDGRDDLVVVSPAESVVAWTTRDLNGRLRYPEPLPLGDGKPLLLATGDLDGDGRPDVATVVEESKQYRLVVASLDPTSDQWRTRRTDLEKFRVPPRGLAVVDADQDGRDDLIVFTAHEPARLLLQKADGGFEAASQSSGFQRGLLDDIAPSNLATGDVDGDGLAEMLIGGGSFVRALRLGADGALEVVDQFNSRSPGTELETGVVWFPRGADSAEVALIGSRGALVERLVRDDDGVFRSRGTTDLEPLDLQRARVVDLGRGLGGDLLLIGSDRVAWIAASDGGLRADTTVVYETDPLEVRHSLVATGDLDGDGSADVVAVDATDSRVLEVLQRREDGWRRTLRFTVFESDPHYQGQTGGTYEPREMVVADVSGDGLDDLVLLVHDRILVYPQLASERAVTQP